MTQHDPASHDFDGVLDFCLTEMRAGRLTLAASLKRFPEHAARLEPLLRAAQPVLSIPRLSMPSTARDALEARLRAHMRTLPAPRAARRTPPLRAIRWASLTLASVGLAVLVSVSVFAASTGSLPGDTLYPVKRWGESTAVQFADDMARAGLHLEHAQRRLHEFEALSSRGDVEVALLSEFEAAASSAIETSRALAEPQRTAVLSRAASLSQDAIEVVARVPPSQATQFELGAASSRIANLRASALSLLPASATLTPTATHTPSATATSTPSLSPTPLSSATPVGTSFTPGAPGTSTSTPSAPGTTIRPTPLGQGTPQGGLTKTPVVPTPRSTPPGQGTPGGGLTNTPSGQGTPGGDNPPTKPRPTKEN